MSLGEEGILNEVLNAKKYNEKTETFKQLEMEIISNQNKNLKLDASELKRDILKDIKGAEVLGTDFPLIVIKENDTYVIRENGTIGENDENKPYFSNNKFFNTLADAIQKTENNGKIIVLRDITDDSNAIIDKDLTFNLNGKNVTMSKYITVNTNIFLKLVGTRNFEWSI